MAKKIVGNYPDIDALTDLMDSLGDSGYPVDSITVIADADLVDLDDFDVILEEGFDSLGDVSDEMLCQRIENFVIGEDGETVVEEITAYCESLRDGDILVLVEDTLLPLDDEVYALFYGEDDAEESDQPAKRTASKPKAKPPTKTKAKPTPKAKATAAPKAKAKAAPEAKPAP